MKKNLVPFDELGFRIYLVNPPAALLGDGKKISAPNMKKLKLAAFKALAEKPSRLTGDEVHFIRKYLRMTQVNFSRWLNMSTHSTVSLWESYEKRLSGMDYNTEVLLRLQMEALLSKKANVPMKKLENLRDLSSQEKRVTLTFPASR